MRIDSVICPAHIKEKLQVKHRVTTSEAEQVLLGPRIRFLEKGRTKGDDVYSALSVKHMAESRLSSISKADTDEKIGEFWDTHDITDFDNLDAPDVEFEISCNVTLETDLLNQTEQRASQEGMNTHTLVNLWLRQKLAEQTAS